MKHLSYLMLAACLTISVAGCSGETATTPAPGPAVTPPANTDADGAAGSDDKMDESAAGVEEVPAE